MSTNRGWVGVDLDGTLAFYDGWQGENHVGEPVAPMLARVKKWRAEGREVRIMTARVSNCPYTGMEASGMIPEPMSKSECRKVIEAWCEKHVGEVLPVTCKKDFAMIELWDDRAIQVIPNTGERADGEPG